MVRRRSPIGTAAVLSSLIVAWSSFAPPCGAQGLDYVKAHYTKHEYRIPARDGKKLFTAVYVPKDRSQTYPILLFRTPYSISPYGEDAFRDRLGPSELFARSGYIFAYQDVRGRYMSEGDFVNVRPQKPVKSGPADIDESSDTFDTIDWLLRNVPGNSGKVGQWGISYPGFYTAAGMIDAHPALKAASPQAPIADWFEGDDWRHNGAIILPHAFNFMSGFGHPRPEPTTKDSPSEPFNYHTPDGYEFFLKRVGPLSNANARYFKDDVPFWNEMLAHANYDDFWAARNLRPHLKNIKPAVLNVGGWFDAENLYGALEVYRSVEAQSPGATNLLVMGPWNHGRWSWGDASSLGPIPFHTATATHYREQIEFPFFEHFLKGKGTPDLAEARVFETGSNRWRSYDAWPPRNAKPMSLYPAASGRLALTTPAGPDADTAPEAYDEYVSDPAHPVEYLNSLSTRMPGDYMIQDQRFAAHRPDVLVFESPALESDLTVVGPIEVKLFVSTSGTDSDWIVKLIDVYPDDLEDKGTGGVPLGGYQQLVRGDVMRGRFRNSLAKPEPFVPNQVTPVRFRMNDVAHTFRPGHRLMVHVQSTWFPLVDRNPQTFVDIATARESDFQKATQRLYHSQASPTRLDLLVLPR